VLGHRVELVGDRLLGYAEARRQSYLPTYRRVLDHCLQNEIAELRQLGAGQMMVVLDYEIYDDLNDLTSPLSHAALIARYIDEMWQVP